MHECAMGFLKILLLITLLHTTITAQEEEENYELYKLPDNVVRPSNYKIQLTLEDDFFIEKTFSGSVEISVEILTPTTSITLHSMFINYEPGTITIQTADAEEPGEPITLQHEFLEKYQQMVLTASNQLAIGSYTLKFAQYSATLHEDMYGFYLSEYSNEQNEIEYIATTQLQPTHARRVFPCFDEPNFKASFIISITRPAGYISLGNTKVTTEVIDERITDHFAETPVMSTYLLAFIVSKFKGYGIEDGTERLDYDVWCRQEALTTAEYSYTVGPALLDVLGEHTGIKYYDMVNVNKMDQVAIPDFAAGAMENWGLVTYRETALLWDKDQSTISYKQRVATVIAHEFAHMWFGNLVTLDWWAYTWLNEGFARYYQYRAAAEVEKTWELEKQFVIEQQQVIFGTDGLESAAALNADAHTPSQISNKFASLSYNKGASVIRMMVNFLGDTNYVAGIQSYLRSRSYNNARPEHLFAALSDEAPTTLPASLADIMGKWTDQPGFPVVTVSRNGGELSFTQKRFLLNSEASSDLAWYIPLTYTTESESNLESTTVTAWLLPNEDLLIPEGEESEGWVLVNLLASGYYRVNYDDNLWAALETALKAENTVIPELNRAQIVDDVLNLARANILPYSRALDITSFLANDVSYYSWVAAFNGFSFLRRRLDNSQFAGANLPLHISTLMTKLYDSVSFDLSGDLSHIDVLKTALTLQWACQLGNAHCLEKSSELFSQLEDGVDIDPNLRSTVYCTAIRADDTGARWNVLWERYKAIKLATEQVTILTALGCSKNKTTLNDYLQMSIDSTQGIRKQDASSVFSAVLAGNSENVDIAFTFLKQNVDDIVNYYGGMNALTSVISGVADRLTTQDQVTDFEMFVTEQGEALKDAQVSMQNALENAKANLQWVEANLEELNGWFKETYGSAASITLNLTVFAVALATILLNF